MKTLARGAGSLLISILLLMLGGHIRYPHECYDCFQPHGFPFTYRNDGGYAGGGWFSWWWASADIAVALLLAFVIFWTWNRLANQRATSG